MKYLLRKKINFLSSAEGPISLPNSDMTKNKISLPVSSPTNVSAPRTPATKQDCFKIVLYNQFELNVEKRWQNCFLE